MIGPQRHLGQTQDGDQRKRGERSGDDEDQLRGVDDVGARGGTELKAALGRVDAGPGGEDRAEDRGPVEVRAAGARTA